MPSSVDIKTRAVEIYLLIFRFIHVFTCSKDYLTLCLELHHSKLPLCHAHWSSATGNITYLICHISLQDHQITRITWISRSCDILGGNYSFYVITLPILIVAGIMVVGYNILFCHMILQD